MFDTPHQPPALSPAVRISVVPLSVYTFLPEILAILALVFFGVLGFSHYNEVKSVMDIGVYHDISVRADAIRNGSTLQLSSEYPPLATALFWIANSLSSHSNFASAWIAVIVISSICAYVYLRCFSRRDAVILACILPFSVFLLGHGMIFARYDIFVCLALILSARSHAHRAYAESAAWLSIAVALKVVPILAIPVIFLATPRRYWKNLLLGMICAELFGVLLSVGVLGFSGMIDNIQYMMTYHSGRPVQLESLWSGFTMLRALALTQVIHPGFDHLSYFNPEASKHFILLSKFFVFTGLGLLLFTLWNKKKNIDFGILLSSILLWALAMSPVLSPQYFTWIVPLVLVTLLGRFHDSGVSSRGIISFALVILVAYLTQWIYPSHYYDLIDQDSLPILVLNLRNIILVFLTYFVLTDAGVIAPIHTHISPNLLTGIRHTFLMDTMLTATSLFIVLMVYPQLLTTTKDVGFFADGSYEAVQSLPVSKKTDAKNMIVMTNLIVPSLAQNRFFRLRPDDCVQSIAVNGTFLPPNLTQFCDGAGKGRIFDFGPYLHTGKNTVTVALLNTGGPMGLDITASVTPLLFLSLLAVLVVTFWYVIQCYGLYCSFRHSPFSARMPNMIYNQAITWIKFHMPTWIFLRPLRDGQEAMSI